MDGIYSGLACLRNCAFGRASANQRMPGPALSRPCSVWGLILTLARRGRRWRLLSLVQLLCLLHMLLL